MHIQSRRSFMKMIAASSCSLCVLPRPLHARQNLLFAPGEYQRIDASERTYHISCAFDMFDQYEGLPEIWKESGITDVWLGTWYYGHFPYPWEKLDYWLDVLKKTGFRPHLISVPFCHGGGALDPRDSEFPNLPPPHWKIAKRWDGSENWGFSWHSPTDTEGAEAIKTLYQRYGAFDYFLDDDFRFSSTPSLIGGCVCDECKTDFISKSGVTDFRWNELLDDLHSNSDTPLLRAWVDYFCDRLTQCFRAYSAAVPQVDVGIMVMYMGCERGGIRLSDYSDNLFRVGEGGFNDNWFDPPKFKTIELYSVLLHRRYAKPGRAFSETTIYPEKTLSAENLATKLSISTIADVRNTCFMSGLRAIPPTYWPTLTKRMKQEKEFHTRLLGQNPRGPFKHYYGMASRYLGGENAYSLFLALGVPFEVCGEIPADGWTFLTEPDARAVERGELISNGSKLIARIESTSGRFTKIPEDLESLFAFRRTLLDDFRKMGVPYVEEETPVVLAWYPDANVVYLWNLEKTARTLTVCVGEKRIGVELEERGSALLEL
ncbi:MAG: hypothetical protein PHO46_09820 [Thermoguttaceae bacterium]|jgi:hypothetical protein|nr:hypothetical protein [Thermoguttaceae bacterium]